MSMMYEELARERMRADHAEAVRRGRADRLVARRRWRAVARFAQRRVDRLSQLDG